MRVARWTRWGKDRLYVTLAGEVPAGHVDLIDDTVHPASPEHLEVVTRAGADWHRSRARTSSVPAPRRPPSREPAASPVDGVGEVVPPVPEAAATPVARPQVAEPWIDLAANAAGVQVREQALAARRAAPVRSLVARVMGVHTEERAWRIGADGEEKVAGELARMVRKDPRWRVLHAVPVGSRGADIDHVVVGPGGVFTLNSKHHPGATLWVGGRTFLVDGTRKPYLHASQHEARRAARLLSAACGFAVPVQGVVVPVGATSLTVKPTPAGVDVVDPGSRGRGPGDHRPGRRRGPAAAPRTAAARIARARGRG